MKIQSQNTVLYKQPKQLHHNAYIGKSKYALLFILFITFLGLALGQTSNKNKFKPKKVKDSIAKIKLAIPSIDKLTVSDTVKKNIPTFNQQEIVLDSLFLVSGSFKLYKKNAHASYYANKFHNHKTASGKRYDKNKLTAAHKKLPFGTIVKVTNEANGKSIIVEINDRGPFVRSREIDLSRRAFMEINGGKSSGNMKVTLEILQK
jgi:rare lipoprotein A